MSLGHHRIGLVYGVGAHEHGLDRLEPYKESISASGMDVDPDLIVECGPTLEDGYQGTVQLLKLATRPTAIVVINDLLAMGALRAAADLGLRVPEDVSVVGFDNIPMANYLVPRLTTVTKNAFAGGQKAFELLLSRIRNPELPRQIVYGSTQLIVRESTGPAPF
jgi:LacI family transcriptional regulator